MYRYQFEKGSRKHVCPSCGHKRTFRRVVDVETGQYLADNVGRCDRVNSCGYSYMAKDFLKDNGGSGPLDIKPICAHVPPRPFDYHEPKWLDKLQLVKPGLWNCGASDRLYSFLMSLYDRKDVNRVFADYCIGRWQSQYRKVYTMLPYISIENKFARGKLIQFDAATGKRSKERFGTSSLRFELGLDKDWNYDTRVFFGEHLIDGTKPIGVVESEKTALICAITHPEYHWIATGTKSSLNYDKIKRIAESGRSGDNPPVIFLFPDGDAYDQWLEIAATCARRNLAVGVSDIVKRAATEDQQTAGIDIADLLIEQQRHRLEDLAERQAIMQEAA